MPLYVLHATLGLLFFTIWAMVGDIVVRRSRG